MSSFRLKHTKAKTKIEMSPNGVFAIFANG